MRVYGHNSIATYLGVIGIWPQGDFCGKLHGESIEHAQGPLICDCDVEKDLLWSKTCIWQFSTLRRDVAVSGPVPFERGGKNRSIHVFLVIFELIL